MFYKTSLISLLLLCNSCFTEKPIAQERKITTIAVVVEPSIYGIHGGSYSLLEFYANGKRYEYRASTLGPKVVGEKYKLWYDSINPAENRRILSAYPVFLKEEITRKGVGEISFCKNGRNDVNFIYYVDNVKYKKLQILEKTVEKYPSFKKGAKFEIEYWIENPQRSILYADKPINTP